MAKRAGKSPAEVPPVVKRKRGGQFASGQSGNPAGRKAGTRNRVTVLCHDLLAGEGAQIMRVLVKKAKAGDGLALRLCMERLVPIAGQRDRPMDAALDLPSLAKAEDLAAAAAAVLHSAAAGSMSMAEAAEFMRLLEGHRRILETTELVVRLEALEAAPVKKDFGFAGVAVDPDIAARVRHLSPPFTPGGPRATVDV